MLSDVMNHGLTALVILITILGGPRRIEQHGEHSGQSGYNELDCLLFEKCTRNMQVL